MIVNKCNNPYPSTIKMKSIDVKLYPYLTPVIKLNPKLKIGDMLEYQNRKMLLQKIKLQIGL